MWELVFGPVVSLQSMAASLPSWKQAWTGGQARKEAEYWMQLEPQVGLELIWSFMQHIFISLIFLKSLMLSVLVLANFFQIGVDPPPKKNVNFLTKISTKKNLVSQYLLCCSQNLPKHIIVLMKSILKPLFTVYRLFLNVNFWVDPPSPSIKNPISFYYLDRGGRGPANY